MKKKITAILLLSFALLSEVASDSDYAQQKPYFSLSDQVNDTLGQPRMILCFMSKLRPDLMVTRTGQDYLALVNQAACDEAGQVSSGPQSSGGAASSSSNSSSTAISYTEVVVNAARASSSDPMVVKAWVPETESSSEEMMIYTYTEATAGVSDDAPFGDFLMRFTGSTLETSTDFFLGYLQASGSQLTYSEEFTDPFSGETLRSKAVINLGEGDTGNGAVSGYTFNDMGELSTRTDVFAYNETIFCRKKVVQNGSPINDAPEKCFLTDESKGTKEVFGYFLYNSETGEKFDLPNKGFRVTYNNQYGFADGYGLHFDNETTSSLTSGLTVIRDDDDASLNGLEYTTYFLGGKLIKKEVLKKSLASLSGLSFVSFLGADSSLGINEPGEYKMNYDVDSDTFTITHSNFCGDTGCFDRPLDAEISFTSTDYLSDSSRWGIFGYMPGIGGLGISVDAMRSPTTALVTQEIETDVSPANYPTTLYCVENCPTYTKISALTNALSEGSEAPTDGPYANYNTFGTSEENVVTYSVNSETNVYTAGDGGDAVFGTLSDEVSQALSYSQFGYGAYSGAMVTSLSELTCDIDAYDYCTSPVYGGAVSEYYQWVTGPQRWNQYRGLIDQYGRLVSFSRPISVYFTAPEDTDKYQEFAGKELRLQFGGGEQLWGIPGGCVYDGTFTEDCTNPDTGGYLPWVSKFTIPANETAGRLYENSGQTGSYYLTKPAFGIVILKQDSSYIGTLTLGSVDDLPSLEIVNIGPNGGANFLGYSPTKPSTVSVVHGLSASEAASFSESEDTTIDETSVGENAPIFTSPDAFEVVENTTTVGTLAATDVDGDAVTYNITGFGASPFSVNATSGVVSFREAPDYEARSSYAFTAIASDGVNSSTQSITVTVTNANDKAPVITSARWFNYNPQLESIGNVVATDPEGDTVIFSIESDDLAINENTGALSFISSPTESSYSAVVTASDGTNTSTQIILVFTGGGGDGGGGDGGGDGESGNITLGDVVPNESTINLEEGAATITLTMAFSSDIGVDLNNLPAPVVVSQSGGQSSILFGDSSKKGKADATTFSTIQSYSLSTWSLTDGDSNQGVLVSTGTLPQSMQEGTYSVSTGSLLDIEGSSSSKTQSDVFSIVVEGVPPNIVEFTFDPTSVDVTSEPAVLQLSARVTDASGVDQDRLADQVPYISNTSVQINADQGWTLTSGDEFDGYYSTSITIPTTVISGDYLVFSGYFYDVHGTYAYELPGPGESSGGITISSSQEGIPPTIVSFSIDPETIDVRNGQAILTLNAVMSDESGIDQDRLAEQVPYITNNSVQINADQGWTLTSGDEYLGSYVTTITIPQNTAAGSYQVFTGYFYDVFGNLKYDVLELLTVISNFEGVPPEIVSLDISPDEVNVTVNTAVVTVTINVTDTSGVDQSRLAIPNITPPGGLTTSADQAWVLVSGDEYDGTYQTMFTLPVEFIPANYSLFTGYFYDSLGNFSYTVTDYGAPTGLVVYYDPSLVFEGVAIDGYIEGAEVFVDQNFNFVKDSGEYTATTASDGSFALAVNDQLTYECLINRPIVVNVPVGAVDSTRGVVSSAFQMILPSISDTGATEIVVTPFSSLLSEAVLQGKSDAGIKEDLTVAEGCSSEGDSVASSISSRLSTLQTSIENNFGISLDNLLSDFLENPYEGVNINVAQNIANYFPSIKRIDDVISEYLSDRFDKTIRSNASLHSDSLSTIFSGEYFGQVPLNFQSIYTTSANPGGWYQEEVIKAENGQMSDSGILFREHCSETDTIYCNVNESLGISLENIANTATSYERNSSFINNSVQLNSSINSGSLYVTARDARSWRNNSENWQEPNNRDRECQLDNQIRFRNDDGQEFQYSSYTQGYGEEDCSVVRHYYYPTLTVSSFVDSGESIQLSYYVPDIVRSGIIENAPYDFIKKQLTLDPTDVINDMSELPSMFSQIQTIRRMFNVDEYVLFQFFKTSDITYQFEFDTNPRNDYYNHRDCSDGCENLETLYGQAARDKMFEVLSNEVSWSSTVGSSAPESNVLGRLSEPYIEIIDYNETTGASRSYDVYSTYDKTTKTLDLSLNGAEIDLENIQNFLTYGIGDSPLDAKIYINPDNAISGTMPVKLSLYQGNDGTADVGEDYFTIEFNLDVSASSDGLIFKLLAGEDIVAKYITGTTVISRTITNANLDQIVVTDGALSQPDTLNLKILNLLSTVSDVIDGIQDFFSDGGTYFFKVDLGSSFSIIDFYRNTVDYIQGTFVTKSQPTSGIFVRDIKISEGNTGNLCFTRIADGDLTATSFDLSFTQRDRPGRGAVAEDFSLSSDTVSFAAGETQSCIVVTAASDNAFDWVHEAFLDISQPSNGQSLARDRVKIRFIDSRGETNRISGSANIY